MWRFALITLVLLVMIGLLAEASGPAIGGFLVGFVCGLVVQVRR